VTEPLGVLLLPSKLERFELARHAQNLLEIPRVVALEPPRVGTFGWFADGITVRFARRARFPGDPRALVLYHPRQYPLARALLAHYEDTELWYARPDPESVGAAAGGHADELRELDDRAYERADHVLAVTVEGDPRLENEPLRRRLLELEVISARPFWPGARIHYK
jgi:hypothetical protein